MSVDYRAGLAIGWKVSSTEHSEMNEVGNYEYEDNFICVNTYDDRSGYIFGEWCCTILDGCAEPLDLWSITEELSINFEAYHKEGLRMMGRDDLAALKPTVYIIHQVS